jgi:hypothetical protein
MTMTEDRAVDVADAMSERWAEEDLERMGEKISEFAREAHPCEMKRLLLTRLSGAVREFESQHGLVVT